MTHAPLDAQATDIFGVISDYNTRITLLGASFLGAATGLVGTFLVLRRRALMADTLGHSTLPGVGIAFLLLAAIGVAPRAQIVLLAGAAASACVAAWLVALLQRVPRVREDAALACVLGGLFGLGLAALGVIQQLGTGHAAGIGGYIEGSIALLGERDVWTMVGLALGTTALTVLMFKEFTLIAFDPELAQLQGLPVRRLELLQLTLIVMVTVAGLHAVGLILIIALLVIPSAAARQWSHRLPRVAAYAAVFGAISGLLGGWISALADGLPTGPLIVLVAAGIFVISLLFGTARGRSGGRTLSAANAGAAREEP